jgi:pimeloyl-ACP methyl ester carboxylesterase
MPTITTKDGTEIFYKDWGSGQPIVFSHGWPLSADDWDAQLLFFLHHGYLVAMVARPRPPTATIWTIMPTTWRL